MTSNILLDRLPNCTPSGFRIRTDFRESIKFELLMQDTNLSEKNKVIQALRLYYYDTAQIESFQQAINDILWFYRCGKEIEKGTDNGEERKSKTKQIYSYEFDDEFIYNSFMEQYKIDLNSIRYLHWWKFKTLLNGLNEKTQFMKVLEYRAVDLAKIKDKSKKEYYRKMKKIYALPDMRSEEEKEQDFANELW